MGWNTGFGDGSRSEKGPPEKLHFLYQTMHFRSQRNSQMLKSICITKQNLFTTGKFPNALLRSRSSFTNVLCHSNISGNIPGEMFAIMKHDRVQSFYKQQRSNNLKGEFSLHHWPQTQDIPRERNTLSEIRGTRGEMFAGLPFWCRRHFQIFQR